MTMLDSPESALVTLEAADDSVVRLLQLTDLHILAEPEDCLKGMNTRASFEAVCRKALGDQPQPDLLLATGDLSQDGSAASYRYLADRFMELGLPVFCLPGNHDDSGLMREQLQAERISAAKRVVIGGWLILLLDSTVAGETGGEISAAELDFLDAALDEHADLHALVCLHHQPLPMGSEWIDALGLGNAAAFTDRVHAHENVRGVLWGHVHQQAHHRLRDIEWMATPSTCVQFKAGSKDFALDDLAPGYRQLELHADGRIESRVQRLEDFAFEPG
jgi:Icc protein